MNALRRPHKANARIREEGRTEIRPEERNKEHNLRCNKQRHTITHTNHGNRRVRLLYDSFFNNIAPPAKHNNQNSRNTHIHAIQTNANALYIICLICKQMNIMHVHNCTGREKTARNSSSQRPNTWVNNVIWVGLARSCIFDILCHFTKLF